MDSYLGSQPLQKPVQQHLLVQDFEQGVIQEEPLAPSTLHKLINDDRDHQVQHHKIDAKDEGDAEDGGDNALPAGITCHIECWTALRLLASNQPLYQPFVLTW